MSERSRLELALLSCLTIGFIGGFVAGVVVMVLQ